MSLPYMIKRLRLRAFIFLQHKVIDYLSYRYEFKIKFIDQVFNSALPDGDNAHKSDAYGAYSEELKSAIVYTASVPDLRTLIMSCFHEYRHGIQHQELLSNEEYLFWTRLAATEDPIGLYYKANPLEVDAFVFAATLGRTTSLFDTLKQLSMKEASSLSENNQEDLLKERLFFSTSAYHQIAESLPSWLDICILLCDVFRRNLR